MGTQYVGMGSHPVRHWKNWGDIGKAATNIMVLER